jgi:hypothetical protein
MNNANTCMRWSKVFFTLFWENGSLFATTKVGWNICACQEVMLLWREFSLHWTWRLRLCLQTVKSMLTVLTNFSMTCQQFAVKLRSRQDILKKVHSSKNTIDLVCVTELLYLF